MACTEEGISPDKGTVLLRTADEGARCNGSDEGQGKGDEGGEGGRAPAPSSSNQRQASKKGGEGTIREDGRKDAPQASGATKAQGEAKQAAELMRQSNAHTEEGHWEYTASAYSMASCISSEVLTMDTRYNTTRTWMAMEATRSRMGVATPSHRYQLRPLSTRGSLHSLPRVLLFSIMQ